MHTARIPACISIQDLPMAIGVAIAVLSVPDEATHMLCLPASGEAPQALSLQMAITGTSGAQWLMSQLSSSGGVWGATEIIPIPRHTLITSYSLRRVTTTAALDYAVMYFRQA
jgi:hypothetical protein